MTHAVHYTATIDLARPFPPRADDEGADPLGAGSSGETRPVAYRMPFEVERFGSERIELRNASRDVLRWITIDLMGPGHFVAHTPATLEPDQALAVWLFGDDLARQTKVQVTWFYAGVQYLWLVSL
jgi:hypothetical protein